MRMLMVLALSFALGIVPAVAAPTVVLQEESQVEIPVPDGWKSSKDGGVVKVASPDDSMSIVFMVLPDKGADKAVAQVEKALDTAVGKIDWEDKPEKEKINGLDAEIWEGSAKEGKLQVEAIYLDTPAGKSMAVYWFDTPESEKKFEKEIDVIVKGLKFVGSAK